MKKQNIDKIFLWIVIVIVFIGVVMFTSSSLGIFGKNESKFYGVLISQFLLGLVGGAVAFYFTLKIPYKFWRQYSLIIFLSTIVLTALVFVPGLGFSHGGASRWISIFGISFQPVEFLKIGFVIYFAAWLSWVKSKVRDFKFSILPLAVLIGIIAIVLLKQPDTKSLILIITTAMVMLFISGMPWKYILGIFLISIVCFGFLIIYKPYLRARIQTFVDPSHDPSGASYQLQQSLIAIGSGGIGGRGLGQSIQKFSYLPEPQGDSIFAVIGEELGFIGSVGIIILFLAFTFRGYRIAYRAPDSFSKLLVVGIITLFIAQVFMNIASITGVFPLTGVPLVFMSHGGTALMIAIASMGIILNISKEGKNI